MAQQQKDKTPRELVNELYSLQPILKNAVRGCQESVKYGPDEVQAASHHLQNVEQTVQIVHGKIKQEGNR